MIHFYYDIRTKLPYYNRIEAVKNQPYCSFYFHDKEFSTIDWSLEPNQSLEQLYKNRAQQIREQYEYVILCFSGGADSTNILETFYYNNIKLDEIITVGALSKDQFFGDDSNHNGEIYYNVCPLFNQLNLKETKISIIDYTQFFDKPEIFSVIKDYQTEWGFEVGYSFSPTHWFWKDLYKFNNAGDKKTAIILGVEKPFVYYDELQNKYYTTISDICFSQYGAFQKKDNFERINFYTSMETIDLMKKQLHIVKRFLQNHKQHYDLIQQNYEPIIAKQIYNLKHQLNFQAKKSPNRFLSLRDSYLLKYQNTRVFSIYKAGIQKIVQTGITNNLFKRSITTKRYYL